MATEYLGRKCFVTILEQPSPGASPVLLKQISGYSDDVQKTGLRISFQVQRRLTSFADTSTVKIWNLSPDSRTALAQRSVFYARSKPRFLQVSAGYENRIGAIFNGAIVKVLNIKTGPDWVTHIEAMSYMGQIINNQLNKSWKSTSIRDVINELLAASGLPSPKYSTGAEEVLNSLSLVKDKAVSGSSVQSLRNFVDESGLRLSFSIDGVVISNPEGSFDTSNALSVADTTGLLGSPEITDIGINFKTLLDPELVPGKFVRVTSKTVAESTPGLGNLIILMEVNVIGDTHSDDWRCEAEGLFHPLTFEFSQNLGLQPLLEGEVVL